MVIGFLAAAAPAAAADDDEDDVLLLLLLLLQAASASAAAANAAAAALRRRHRVAGIDGTAKLLCARSLGGGLAVGPVAGCQPGPPDFYAPKGVRRETD
jgi:hypothetical protein